MSEVLAVIIGAILGFIPSVLLLRFNYSQLFAQTVSSNRMNWIDNFREEFSIIVGTVRFAKGKKYCVNKCNKFILEAEQARVKLLTRLNQNTNKFGNEYNRAFAQRLEAIDFSNLTTTTEEDVETLIIISRKILEPEWDRVKEEAKGENQ